MKLLTRRWAFLFSLAAASAIGLPQEVPINPNQQQQDDVRLPNGKSQRDEILKAERLENIKDAGRLVKLSEELKADLEKNDRFVLSMATLKKTDDIEKLVKKIRSRLRH